MIATLMTETRHINGGIYATAVVHVEPFGGCMNRGLVGFQGCAFVAGTNVDWIEPSRTETTYGSFVQNCAWGHQQVEAWFGRVQDEIWRRAHPSSAPTLPEAGRLGARRAEAHVALHRGRGAEPCACRHTHRRHRHALVERRSHAELAQGVTSAARYQGVLCAATTAHTDRVR